MGRSSWTSTRDASMRPANARTIRCCSESALIPTRQLADRGHEHDAALVHDQVARLLGRAPVLQADDVARLDRPAVRAARHGRESAPCGTPEEHATTAASSDERPERARRCRFVGATSVPAASRDRVRSRSCHLSRGVWNCGKLRVAAQEVGRTTTARRACSGRLEPYGATARGHATPSSRRCSAAPDRRRSRSR